MTTETDIVNRALSAFGARSTILNMQERSNEAAAARLLYEPTRKAMLRAAHWNFARKTAYLSLLKAAPGTPQNPESGSSNWQPSYPAPPWAYEYAYPSDCLQMRRVIPQWNNTGGLPSGIESYPSYMPVAPPWQSAQPFIVATDTNDQNQRINVILTNQQLAIGVWTADIEEVDLWDDLFQEAMVCALASRMVIDLSGDKTLARGMAERAMVALDQARVRDGDEGSTEIDPPVDWLMVRGYSGTYSTGVYGVNWITPSFLVW